MHRVDAPQNGAYLRYFGTLVPVLCPWLRTPSPGPRRIPGRDWPEVPAVTAKIFEFPDPRAAARLGFAEPAIEEPPSLSRRRGAAQPKVVPPLDRPRRALTDPERDLQTRLLD